MATTNPADQRRKVRCRVLTPVGWIEGDFRVPALRNFLEHLAALHEFEVLTDVRFLSTGHVEPFFDLHRDAILVVLPPPSEAETVTMLPHQSLVRHDVHCLLRHGHVHGKVDVLPSVRLSDYFRSRRGYVTFRNCRFVPHALESEVDASEPFAAVVVSTDAIIGVSEREDVSVRS